jgi:hypothetical protein
MGSEMVTVAHPDEKEREYNDDRRASSYGYQTGLLARRPEGLAASVVCVCGQSGVDLFEGGS